MKRLFFILTIIALAFCNCQSTKQQVIKKQLSLTRKEYKIIKNDSSILSSLHSAISIDSIDVYKIETLLDTYFQNNNKKELISILEMYSVFGNRLHIKAADLDRNDPSIPSIDSIKELKAFIDKVNQEKKAIIENFNKSKSSVKVLKLPDSVAKVNNEIIKRNKKSLFSSEEKYLLYQQKLDSMKKLNIEKFYTKDSLYFGKRI